LQAVPSIHTIWPPNNKFVPVTVHGVSDPDGDPVSLKIDSIFQDERVSVRKGLGDGDGVGSDTAHLRAKRVGSGNGRVYHISFTADDGQGGSCTGEVVVGVPHDRGKGSVAVDDGPIFDSTSGQGPALDSAEKRAGKKLCRETYRERSAVARQAATDCREACARRDRECRRACQVDKREARAIYRADAQSCREQYR
jgi:hypothetical protein